MKANLILSAAIAVALCWPMAEAGEPLKLSQVKWDFEDGTLSGWTIVKGDLGKQPSSNDNDRWNGNFNKHGKYFIGTYEDGDKAASDQLTGELRSPVAVVDTDIIGLLVGGGEDLKSTYVALCDADGDKELLKAAGRNAEAMTEIVWDVSKFKGKTVYVKIVDRSTGGWGHINVDYIRALDKADLERLEREKREAADRARKAEEEMRQRWTETNADYCKTVLEPVARKVYRGDTLRHVWMPVGGVGAGGMAIGGDGGFLRWMIHDGKAIQVPDAFFAVRAKAGGGQAAARLLKLGGNGVKDIEFYGEFPIAFHKFLDEALPVRVSMESFSPFIPLNEKDSALPVVLFFVTVENPGNEAAEVTLLGSLQNSVGRSLGDKDSGPTSVDNKGYGGSTVAAAKVGRFAGAEMTQSGKPGSMVLMAAGGEAKALEPWTDAKAFWQTVSEGTMKALDKPSEPTPAGKTANAAVALTFTLKAGEKRTVPFLWAWHLPGGPRATHMYENWFAGAADVCKYVDANFDRLAADTRLFRATFFDSTLPYYVVERVSSQCSTLSTRVVNWTKQGNVYGWEGLGC
ncbi:MAG: GH116 family glycosyl-hydrolase, partial [Planctomycetota bacterium]|nr:GH116 family glycosyl-hydrolase [Planctomycetota bacterium]